MEKLDIHEIEKLVHGLTDAADNGGDQRALVDSLFTPCAGFTHPLCRIRRRPASLNDRGSREGIKSAYAVYKALTRDIEIDIVRVMIQKHSEEESLTDNTWRDNTPPSSSHRYLLKSQGRGQTSKTLQAQDGSSRRVIDTATCIIDLRESFSAALSPREPRWLSRIYNLRLVTTLHFVKLSESFLKRRNSNQAEAAGKWYIVHQHDAFPVEHLAEIWAWPAVPLVVGFRASQWMGGLVSSVVGRFITFAGIW